MQSDKKVIKAILDQLKNPFPTNLLKYRIGATTKDKRKAIPLFYLTARDIAKRLDDVLGFDGWNKTTELITTSSGLVAAKTTIGIKLPSGEWLYRDGIGEPSNVAPPLGAESHSFKRAASNFGIGRYLYYVHINWQPIDEYKNFTSDPRKLLPSWALPDEKIVEWEKIAEQEYDAEGNIDFEDLSQGLVTAEEMELLRKSEEVKKAILARKAES